MTLRPLGQAAVCGLALLFGAQAAQSGSFQVNPVRVSLSDDHPVGSLTVSNSGDQPAVVQLQIQRWTQLAGEDAFADTADLLATPPIMTVPPGESRVIRVGVRQRPDATTEASYRLFVQEVPPPPRPGFQGLQVALRFSIPVFVAPAQPLPPDLHWQGVAIPGGVNLSLANRGNTHVQVLSLQLSGPDGVPAMEPQDVSDYLLPGQTRRWQLKTHAPVAPGMKVTVHARTDGGDATAEFVVGSP